MIKNLRTLYNYRDLLWLWSQREIKIRYKQSVLGGAWAILQPLSLMLIFTVVFSVFVEIPSDGFPYPVFSYAALLPWMFLATSMDLGVSSLVRNMNLISKISFPKEVLPLATIFAGLVDFAIGFIIFLLLLLLYKIQLSTALLWLVVILLIQLTLVVGIVLIASALNVFYRDIRYVIPLTLQLWFYATPIVYPASAVPEWLWPYYALNPMVGIINSYRRTMLLHQAPLLSDLAFPFIFSVVLCAFAFTYFKRVEWQFADII